jgi:Tol biopolymer transport system component
LTQGATIDTIAPIDPDTVLYTGRAADGTGPWLWAVDVRSKSSHRISAGLEQYTSISTSADGRTLAASRSIPRAGLWSVPILEHQAGPADVQPEGPSGVRALAPQARGTALYYLSALDGADGLWRLQKGQATEVWAGSRGALFEAPSISRDGLHAAIVLRRNGRRRLAVVDTDASGSARLLAEEIDIRGSVDWSPDGRWIVAAGETTNADGRTAPGLFKVPAEGNGPPVRLVQGQAAEPIWSPTGDLILYSGADVGGLAPLMGIASDGTVTDFKVSTKAGGANHRFLADGKSVVLFPGPQGAPEFWLLDVETGKTRQLTRLGNRSSPGQIRSFDISGDGKRIIFDRTSANADIVLIRRP